MIGTVGTDPPLRPGPWRVRNRVVPVPRRGFRLPAVAKQPPMSLHGPSATSLDVRCLVAFGGKADEAQTGQKSTFMTLFKPAPQQGARP
jgi:hypothetical protein